MRIILLAVLILFSAIAHAQMLVKASAGTNTSIRGLSVVDDSTAWASGSNGWFARTVDGANTWKWQQLEAYKTLDFRDIEAFSANEAVIMNAGSPAVILRTTDGGKTWAEAYRNNSPDIFLDGLTFSNSKNGMAFGDPINHKMQLLKTTDGGISWPDISHNLTVPLIEGEAGFAASGTSISSKNKKVWIATGGTHSRVFYSPDFGRTWQQFPSPLIQGESTQGAFSIAFKTAKKGVVAGGDYKNDSLRTKNLALTANGGKTWYSPSISTFGYRSAICYLSKKTLLATGTSGTDISYDAGNTWKSLSLEGFNSIAVSKTGKLVICAGAKGRIYTLKGL